MESFYWIWVLAWLLFYGIHSGLAAHRVKKWVCLNLSFFHRNYRVIYNAFNLLAFSGIWIYGTFFVNQYLLESHWVFVILGMGFCLWGAKVGLAAFQTFDTGKFLFGKQDKTPTSLIKSGWYGHVRHPLYFALLLVLFGIFSLWPTMKMGLFAMTTCLYLPFGMYYEERKLIREFGSSYLHYMEQTPQIIPNIWTLIMPK
ncbi:MAG: hypothetical protein GVX78_00225 [Bacteroidetes bacterium]|jgi:protein-S-isoprenylcysteine O-methyltransferase Ste14|nr:hypothetical protein [Bacteroidota bacterium]